VAAVYLISDLHLDGSHPAIAAQFTEFLRGAARSAQALYILGDLFEAWLGDDDPDPGHLAIQQELRQLTHSGVPCYVMHGNRDFLIGKDFCRRTGCQLLKDGTVVALHGQRILLMHGDTLCTDDIRYQRLRRALRNPLTVWILRHLPLAKRRRLASWLRAGSKEHIARTEEYIMDVNAAAVQRAFDRAHVTLLVHGHTHRPAIHNYQQQNRTLTRIVLGDWHAQGSVLKWDAGGFNLTVLPRPA
jgi:UDP-2,3-diacylglucosamine hydrolase